MGNFFIFEANAPKMFTDNFTELHNLHTTESPSELFCRYHSSALNCECVWLTRVFLSLCPNILTRVGTAARNVLYLFV